MMPTLFTACNSTKKRINSPVVQNTATPSAKVPATHTLKREDIKSEITLWHYDEEEGIKIIKAFNAVYPNAKVKLFHPRVKDPNNRNQLTSLIRSGIDVPDVFYCEFDFVKRLVETPNVCADLTERARDYVGNMVPYTIDVGTDESGVLRALAHQACAGALTYKKPIARKYLGTDDPDKISEMMSTPEKMLETARIIKKKSGGKVALFPTYEEPQILYLGGRSAGWIVDNKLNIDKKMIDFIDFAKTLRDNKYEARLNQWSPGWSAALADDEKALVWACPIWGIPWIVCSNDKKAANGGRWGLAKPPYPFFWWGNWFGIYAKSENQDLAWEFIKYFTTDKNAMKEWSDYSEGLPNNLEVISQGSVEDSKIMGTNIFKFYEPLIKDINGKLITQYDDTINNAYQDCMRSYLAGKTKSKDEMLKSFKDKVKTLLKDVTVE
ncbi:ABC transporter substrate-binding protein [Pseudobacteroides cellulosolvens]|nr:extracellular solute-binding protein [Pseudobacteroides cellulosolvens]